MILNYLKLLFQIQNKSALKRELRAMGMRKLQLDSFTTTCAELLLYTSVSELLSQFRCLVAGPNRLFVGPALERMCGPHAKNHADPVNCMLFITLVHNPVSSEKPLRTHHCKSNTGFCYCPNPRSK